MTSGSDPSTDSSSGWVPPMPTGPQPTAGPAMPAPPSWGQPSHDQHGSPSQDYGQQHPQPHNPPAWGQQAYDQPAQGQPAWGQPPQGQPAWGQQAYDQPAQGQPAWGQQAYDQPAQGQPAWGRHAYDQPAQPAYRQQPPTADSPYQITPAQYYRDQGYAGPEPEPYPTQARPAPLGFSTKRSSVLGVVSFAIVAAMTVVCVAVAQSLGRAYATILLAAGSLEIDASSISDEAAASVLGPTMTLGAASVAGIIGLVIGIVAAVSRRGRGWGVSAIILGLLAPVIWFAVMVVILMPIAQALS